MRQSRSFLIPVMAILAIAASIALSTRFSTAGAPDSVTVLVSCATTPETTTVLNNLSQPITVNTITSVHDPHPQEPFTVNTQVPAGGAVTFSSGTGAPSPALTQQFIYDNEAANEGAQVMTSVGSFTVLCSQGSVTRTAPGHTASATETTSPGATGTAAQVLQTGTLTVLKDCLIVGPDGTILVPPPPEGNFGLELLKGLSSPQKFELEAKIADFNLACGQSRTFTDLVPGSYSVFEAVADNQFGQIANFCINVEVEAGKTASCNLTNEKFPVRVKPPSTGDGGMASASDVGSIAWLGPLAVLSSVGLYILLRRIGGH